MASCLIIVSRDQHDLRARLTTLYAGEEWIEIRLDRRTGQPWSGTGERADRRVAPRLDPELTAHGFAMIARGESGCDPSAPFDVAASQTTRHPHGRE